MELVKRETCKEYLKRRLSEGWKLIEVDYPKAVLMAPWGQRRELDVRNDVLTLRPNDAGDEENITSATSGAGHHHEDVDEETPDEHITTVWTMSAAFLRDLYNLPNHTTETGIINKITVYTRCRGETWP